MIVQTFNILIVPRAEDFPFEIFTSAQSGPNLLCVVIGNISQEDILDNLPPGNLKDGRFFCMKCQNINLRQPNISQEDIFDNLPQGNKGIFS